jgi:hypothetical protein
MAHLNNPIPDVRLERPDLPEAVQQVIATSMAKTAKERYATPGNLADALRAAAKEPQHTPHGLLFTDVQGRVIFVNNHLLKLLNRAETEARRIVGRPMHELLGIEPEAARLLVQDIGKIGRVYSRPLEARDAHGSSILLLCTGEATYDDKGVCIGADLSLRSTAEPAAAAPSTPQAASYDTSEKSYIQLYFTSQIDALRVLLVRVGGPRLGNTLDRIIQETSERNGWPVVVHDGRVEADLRRVEVLVYHALLAKAVAYVVSVVGPALVERQMSLVDAHMGPRSLELASQMGLRELLHSSH